MVFAVKQPVEDLSQRADVVQVVQDDDERHIHSIVLAVALVGQVGQILAQFLMEASRMSLEREDPHAPGLHCPRPRQEEGPPYEVIPWTQSETLSVTGHPCGAPGML